MKFYNQIALFCLTVLLLFQPAQICFAISPSSKTSSVPFVCYNFSDEWEQIARSSKYYRVICKLTQQSLIQAINASNNTLSCQDKSSTILSSLHQEHMNFLHSIHPSISYTILGEWTKTYNGFALFLRGYSIPTLTKNQYIEKIYLDKDEYFPVRDIAIETIQRNEINDFEVEEYSLPILPNKNICIGIVDTGIDYNHDDFYPKGYKGEQTKVQGGWDCYHLYEEEKEKEGFRPGDPDPMDDNYRTGGHGTHVAGIAAGNNPSRSNLQGICPDATLFAYKVFPSNVSGGAPSYTIISAAEYATQDQCSVINLSLGHEGEIPSIEENSPYYDSLRNARRAGVMVIASAGNDGSRTEFNPWPLHAPGVFDSILQVGATDDRVIQPFRICNPVSRKVYFGQTSRFAPPFDFTFNGKEIVYCGFGSENECSKIDLKDKIALIKRGPKDNGISFHDKNLNAKYAGASGCIIFNYNSNSFSPNLFPEDEENPYSENFIPCMMISLELETELQPVVDGLGYIEFLDKQSSVASYTSAGPCYSADNGFFKPDLCAPGTSIYSSVPNFKKKSLSSWSKKQGTSMSTPVITGCAALLRSKYPSFPIEAIESLLMNTADLIKNPLNNNYVSFHYQGAGEVNLKNAMETPVYATPKSFIIAEEKRDEPITITLHNFSKEPISINISTEIVSNKKYANALVGVFDKPFVTINPESDETIQCWLYQNNEIQEDFLEGVVWFEVIGNSFQEDKLLHIPFIYRTKTLLKINNPIYDVQYSLSSLDMNKENFGFIGFSLASGSIYRDVFFDKETNEIIRKKDKVRNLAEQVYVNIYDQNDNKIDSLFIGDNIPIGNYQILWNGLDLYHKQFLPNGQYYFQVSIPLHYRYYSVVQNEDESEQITYTKSEDQFLKSEKVSFEIINSTLPPFPEFCLCSPQKVKNSSVFVIEFLLKKPFEGSSDVTVTLDPLLEVIELNPSPSSEIAYQKETNSIRMKTNIHISQKNSRYSFGQIYVKNTLLETANYLPSFMVEGTLSYKYPLKDVMHRIYTPNITTLHFSLGDFNHNGRIDSEDYRLIQGQFGNTDSDESWNPEYDIFQDGTIDVKDLWYMVKQQ